MADDESADKGMTRGMGIRLGVLQLISPSAIISSAGRGAGTVWSVPSAERPLQSLACATRPAEQDNRSRQG